jgi:cytosine deaminase
MTAAMIPNPAPNHYWLINGRIPLACLADTGVPRSPISELAAPPFDEALVAAHVEIQAGQIAAIVPASQPQPTDSPCYDLDQGLLWPCFVDSHTHLDKGHTWPRRPNPTGTFDDALTASSQDYARWTYDDLYRRMDFGLRCSYAHGTQALRTHLDYVEGNEELNFKVFEAIRQAWADKLTLQAVGLTAVTIYGQPNAKAFADLVADHGAILGGVVYPDPNLEDWIERAFILAEERGLELDFHVDESLNPEAEGLRIIAETKLRRGFQGRVTCGHCCSLSVQAADRAQDTLRLVKEAGITVVSLPLCNLYLQDRHRGRMPRYRGVTLLPELHQLQVAVALASDNCRDPFFAYGDHDMVEVFTQSVRIGHLDRPIDDWAKAVTATPAQIMDLPGQGLLGQGVTADIVIFSARTFNELLSRPQSDRIVLRQGQPIDTTPPDYRLLDTP